MKSIELSTPIRFKGQHCYVVVNKDTSSSLLTTECTDCPVPTICDFQVIIPAIKIVIYMHYNSPLLLDYGVL